MSRRTPIEDLKEEDSEGGTPSRRRSTRIAAVVTTRRASASEDIPGKITKSKRLSLSQELEKDDPKASSRDPSTPQKKIPTRSASKSPSSLAKIEDVPARRTRRRASSSSIMDEETQKEDRAESPVLSKMTTRRASLRSMSTSPTFEDKPSTPRKSTRAISASPTTDLAKTAPPKLRGRRPSATERIVPLEAIEEAEPKTEEAAANKEADETNNPASEENSDDNLSLKKKKVATLKKQNLQTIEENEVGVDDGAKKEKLSASNEEEKLDVSEKEETALVIDENAEESSDGVNKASENSKTTTENVEKKALKRESDSPETPATKSKTARLSLSLKSKRSPECQEETELKAVLNTDVGSSPRRSPRLSTDSFKIKQTHVEATNVTAGSDESFHLKLNLSQFDTSQESGAEEKSASLTVLQENGLKTSGSKENGLNTSGSSNTSDKENQHQTKLQPENPESLSKKKLVVLAEKLNLEKSPLVEKVAALESAKPSARRSALFEPMEVEDFPPDYEYSGLQKKDETDHSPKPSSKTQSVADKLLKPMEELTGKSPKLVVSPRGSPSKGADNFHESPITKTTFESSDLSVDAAPVQAYPVTTELAKVSSPQRRSARLLNQSKNERLEEEEEEEEEATSVVNSTPKHKSPKRSIGDDLGASLNETTVSINEHDLESTKDAVEDVIPVDAKGKSEEAKEEGIVGINKMSESLNKSADVEILETSVLDCETDQNRSISVDKSASKNASNLDVIVLDDSTLNKTQDEDNSDDDLKGQFNNGLKNKSGSQDSKSNPKDPQFSEYHCGSEDIIEIEEDSTTRRKSKDKSEDSNGGDKNKKRDSILKSTPKDKKSSEQSGNSNEEPKFSEESDSEDMEIDHSKEGSALGRESKERDSFGQQRKSNGHANVEALDEDLNIGSRRSKSNKNSSEQPRKSDASKNGEEDVEASTSLTKQTGKRQTKSSSDEEEEAIFSEDSEDDLKAPFLLYTIKSKKSANAKPTTSNPTKDNEKSSNEPKRRDSSIVLNSDSEAENDTSDLDAKIHSLIAKQVDDNSSSSSNESVTHFLDDLAEEGEEDTPSEGSNDIIERGESIGSSESIIDSDDSYENDSFIDDNEDIELLSGEEYDLGAERRLRPKKKPSRIIAVSDSEDEVIVTESPTPSKPEVTEPKEKVTNGIQEDSDLEKMSTQPYCGLTPPSIISLRDSLSDSDKIEPKEATPSVLINKKDNLKSLEQLKKREISEVLRRKSQLTPKAAVIVPTIITPNNSILEDEATGGNKSARKRHSSISIQENINLGDIAAGSVSDRISKVVDIFCSSVKEDGKDTGNISLNISLEFLKSPSPSNDGNDPEDISLEDEVAKKRLSSEPLNESKSKLGKKTPKKLVEIEDKTNESKSKLEKKTPKKLVEIEDKSMEEAVKIFEQGPSSVNKTKPNPEEQLKLSAKKQKLGKQQDTSKITPEDQTNSKKRLSKGRGLLEPKQQNEMVTPETNDEWETYSDVDSGEDDKQKLAKKQQKKRKAISSTETEAKEESGDDLNLPIKKKLSRKERRKQKKLKALLNSTETVDNEEKTEEDIPEELTSESDMSRDLDEELNEKYSSNTSEEIVEEPELKIIPRVNIKKSKKKSELVAKQLKSDEGSQLVKMEKKRKRDKSANQNEDLNIENQTVSKSKKQKAKSKPATQGEYTTIIYPAVKSKKPKYSKELDVLSDEVFGAEPEKAKKKNKKALAEELQPENVPHTRKNYTSIIYPATKSNKPKYSKGLDVLSDPEPEKAKKKNKKALAEKLQPENVTSDLPHTKKKKNKTMLETAGQSSSLEKSKFQYFPSVILNTLTKTERLTKTEEVAGPSNPRKKPKLLPSATMSRMSWEAAVVNSPLLPSKTSTKSKTELESFNKKDFKNLMLYDSSRVKRMDSKNLLKKKQKMKF